MNLFLWQTKSKTLQNKKWYALVDRKSIKPNSPILIMHSKSSLRIAEAYAINSVVFPKVSNLLLTVSLWISWARGSI